MYLLLSEGSLEKSSLTSTPRLSVMFGILHTPYLLHLYNLFEPYTNNGVKTIEITNNKIKKSYTFTYFFSLFIL
jgi:hypothetical protein